MNVIELLTLHNLNKLTKILIKYAHRIDDFRGDDWKKILYTINENRLKKKQIKNNDVDSK